MLPKLVKSIIFGRQKFCRLCFCDVDDGDLRFHDEVMLNSNIETISAMLMQTLGGKYTSNMSVDDIFCTNCVELLKISYNFIRTCKVNSERLEKTVDVLSDCFQNTAQNITTNPTKSVLIQIDTRDFTYMQFYQYRKSARNFPASLDKGCSRYSIENKPRSTIKAKLKREKKAIQEENPIDKYSAILKKFEEANPKNRAIKSLENRLKQRAQSLLNTGSRKHVLKMNPKSTAFPQSEVQICPRREGLRQPKQKPVTSDNDEDMSDTYDVKKSGKKKKSYNILKKKQDPQKCKECGKIFIGSSNLKRHWMLNHNDKFSFECEYCSMKFKVRSLLNEHVRKEHLEPSVKCDICGATFRSLKLVYDHRRRHFNPKSSIFFMKMFADDDL